MRPIEVLLLALVLTAAVYDLRWRRIPNWLAAAGAFAGLSLNAVLADFSSAGGWTGALKGLGVAFAIYFPLYLLRAMGAGDVKLMMAVGTMVGWRAWFLIFILTGITGGVMAVCVLLWRKRVKKTIWNLGFLLNRIFHLQAPYIANEELDVRSPKSARLPHAVSIAVGTVLFLSIAHLR